MTAIIRYNGVFSAPADTPTGPLPTITSDTFNRANSTDIIGSVSDGALGGLGISWEGYPANAVALVDGKLVKGAAGGTFSVGLKIPSADVDVTFHMSAALTSGSGFYVDVRRANVNSGQSPDCYRINFGNTTLGLSKRVSGATTNFASGITYAPGDVIRLTVRGDTLTLRINNVVVHQATDSSISLAGYVCLSGTGSAAGFGVEWIAVNNA